MRIGILTFVSPKSRDSEDAARLTERQLTQTLREREVDVIPADGAAAAQSGIDGAREAERFARADCDAVLFVVTEGALASSVAQAALRAPGPLLLAGSFGPAFFDAAGALEEIGVSFDRLLLTGETLSADFVENYLRENARAERQRGGDAAQKLYGQRLALFGDPGDGPLAFLDPAQWRNQFGVTVVRYGSAGLLASAKEISAERLVAFRDQVAPETVSEEEARLCLCLQDRCTEDAIDFCCLADRLGETRTALFRAFPVAPAPNDAVTESAGLVCAPEEDACGALAMQILRLITGVPPAAIHAVLLEKPLPIGEAATFAQISRRAGRFVCHLFTGGPDDEGAAFGPSPDTLFRTLSGKYIYHAAGNHVGALRAACEALDITPLLLR